MTNILKVLSILVIITYTVFTLAVLEAHKADLAKHVRYEAVSDCFHIMEGVGINEVDAAFFCL